MAHVTQTDIHSEVYSHVVSFPEDIGQVGDQVNDFGLHSPYLATVMKQPQQTGALISEANPKSRQITGGDALLHG